MFNKSQRIFFEQSSANGILLFRETSAIICTYGSRILEIPVNQDIYAEKYKGIRLMLNVLTCALSGGYVNFGVFALYDDKALQNALDVSLQMCLQIPLDDILTYMKLSKAYFGFLEVLMKGHLDVLCGLDSSVFITLIKTLHEGLQSSGRDSPSLSCILILPLNCRCCRVCPLRYGYRSSVHLHIPQSKERQADHPTHSPTYHCRT